MRIARVASIVWAGGRLSHQSKKTPSHIIDKEDGEVASSTLLTARCFHACLLATICGILYFAPFYASILYFAPLYASTSKSVSQTTPGRDEFARLTAQAEKNSLLVHTALIGTRERWEELVTNKGLRFAGHCLVRKEISITDRDLRSSMES
jgi:hypothetical protein